MLEARVEHGEIRIKPSQRKRLDLDELLASVPAGGLTEEWDTGPAVGAEVWWRDEEQDDRDTAQP